MACQIIATVFQHIDDEWWEEHRKEGVHSKRRDARTLVTLYGEVTGKDLQPHHGPAREGDIYRSVLANETARRGLGWQPVTSLPEGLRRTVEYFRQMQ